MEHKWLFDTGAALTCMSSRVFRKISKIHRPTKINAIGTTAWGASGSNRVPEGVYMIPMEWNGKKSSDKFRPTNSSQPTILGIDVIYNLGITYLTETKQLMFQSEIMQSNRRPKPRI
jgi:hypothetical protein